MTRPGRPAPALLIFDGDCSFCSTTVDKLRAWLPSFPEAHPSQWVELDQYGLTQEDVDHYVWYVTDKRQYAGHLALSAFLRSQPTLLLRFAGWMIATPPFSLLASAGYALLSRYRHLMPGGTPACALPRRSDAPRAS